MPGGGNGQDELTKVVDVHIIFQLIFGSKTTNFLGEFDRDSCDVFVAESFLGTSLNIRPLHKHVAYALYGGGSRDLGGNFRNEFGAPFAQ